MSQQELWRSVAQRNILQARADLLKAVRSYFEEQEVLEVETPVLSKSAVTDPQLDPMRAEFREHPLQSAQEFFLQTSPEFAMKRLLAGGSGSIYQICKSFRNGESGRKHNPEFTMLEWYRLGFNEHQLMDEVKVLVQSLYPQSSWQKLSYQQLFQKTLGFNPHAISLSEIAKIGHQNINIDGQSFDKDAWLDLLFSHLIEPEINSPLFVFDFPASQAALAKKAMNEEGFEIGRRFELIIGGMEIANGYFELTDANEQQERFMSDQAKRTQQNKINNPIDENLLAALENGLPECAGVALGLDRLLMLICGLSSIEEVLAFPISRA